ncbi:class I SAM-dependent methyltransferase [Gramella sp. MT6]|uniref:class I SAM-dependent methyltransferase n=1 Tax=Gramella sp. MT6 TaxID=2705471 RepID=UPI001C5EDE22|nr:methyltransferase domain-containing protein [Gramella sp. MT6]QYA24034.1 class I SAM-dependent methyltransferase [Gramella sp. MT6]
MKKILKKFLKLNNASPQIIDSRFDSRYLNPNVPLSTTVSHMNWPDYIFELGNHSDKRILEIGSREVTGISNARKRLSKAKYIGFDYYPGANVDVVGDAHKLSSYFENEDKFDIIFSSACFEHFAMPWKVTSEIAKVLKVGGYIMVETHFAYSAHERPWHFFHFTDIGLKTLFSPALGFECIEAGMSNPLVARFSSLADKYLRLKPVRGLYCHSEFFGKKVMDVEDFSWDKVEINELIGDTQYPIDQK